ncbi:Calcium/calmodulin-dependent protein kinase, partial [Globisporangium splendens]
MKQQQLGNESARYGGDDPLVDAALSVKGTMRQDVALCEELILHAEHELGAIREEIAIPQEKLNANITPLSETKRRALQIKIGALTNTLKFKSGDLYQRKNELRRKEAVLHQRLNDQQHGGRTTRSRRSRASLSSPHHQVDADADGDDANPHPYLKTVERAMQEDELHRHDIVEKYGAAFLKQRIDGAMLRQATDGDLEELGVSLRLHRVRILDAVASAVNA